MGERPPSAGAPVARPPLIVRLRSPHIQPQHRTSPRTQHPQQPPQRYYYATASPRTATSIGTDSHAGGRLAYGVRSAQVVMRAEPPWSESPPPSRRPYSASGPIYSTPLPLGHYTYSPAPRPMSPPVPAQFDRPYYPSPCYYPSPSPQNDPSRPASAQYLRPDENHHDTSYPEEQLIASVRECFAGGLMNTVTPPPGILVARAAPPENPSSSTIRLPSISNFSRQASPGTSYQTLLESYQTRSPEALLPFRGPTATLESTPRITSNQTETKVTSPTRIVVSGTGPLAGKDIKEIIEGAKGSLSSDRANRGRQRAKPTQRPTARNPRRATATVPGKSVADSKKRRGVRRLPGFVNPIVLNMEMPSPLPLPSPSSDEESKPEPQLSSSEHAQIEQTEKTALLQDMPPPLVVPASPKPVPASPKPVPASPKPVPTFSSPPIATLDEPPNIEAASSTTPLPVAEITPQRQSLRLCINRKNLAVSVASATDNGTVSSTSSKLKDKLPVPDAPVSRVLSTAPAETKPETRQKTTRNKKPIVTAPSNSTKSADGASKNQSKKMSVKSKGAVKKSKTIASASVATVSSGHRDNPEVDKLGQGIVDLTSANSILGTAVFDKIDFRAKLDLLPAAVRYEIMGLMPSSYKTVDSEGRVELREGVLGKSDHRFRKHMQEWQSSLAAGEFDTDIRRKYVETSLATIDRWKVENFEPAYGDIMKSSSTGAANDAPAPSSSSRS